jgi:hypothetical protein
MAFLGQEFSRDELPTGGDGNFEPLPEGWYNATITKAEVKPTKAGTGSYIGLRLDITGPTHQGRVIFCNLNINNPNPKAEEIGRQQLNQIMGALGLPTVKDSDQLLGGAVAVKIKIKVEGEDKKNDVAGFRAIAGSSVPSSIPKAATSEPATKSAAPPWAKK